MSIFQAVILGIVQGLTEFLPVSSSGHLVIFQKLFGLHEPALFFDISVHVGTLAAVVIFFRKEITDILVSLKQFSVSVVKKETALADAKRFPNVWFAVLIVVGSVPTAIIGLMLKDYADVLFSSVTIVGAMLLITGAALWSTRMFKPSETGNFGIREALTIGVVQGLAVMPGISRSGSTIVAGLFVGLNKELSARFSFLLSLPAIMGAELLGLKDVFGTQAAVDASVLTGMISAGLVGYGALKFLVFIVKKGQLYSFAPYCWFIGGLALVSELIF